MTGSSSRFPQGLLYEVAAMLLAEWAVRDRLVHLGFDADYQTMHLRFEHGRTFAVTAGDHEAEREVLNYLGAGRGTTNELLAPIPNNPTLDDSLTLFWYDLAATWDSLQECRPPAQLREASLDGHAVRCLLTDGISEEVFVVDLRGRDVEGAAVDLAFAWNARQDAEASQLTRGDL